MQDHFHRISMKIKYLMKTTVADGYPRYQKVLTTMKIYYGDFKNRLLRRIQKVSLKCIFCVYRLFLSLRRTASQPYTVRAPL